MKWLKQERSTKGNKTMANRTKARAVTVYLDPKYNDTINYLKLTQGLTNYIEHCLDAVKVDPEKLKAMQVLKT